MANKHFTFGSTFVKSKSASGATSITIKGKASTNATDRVGDIIVTEAWSDGGLENFKANPVILFNHDYDQPIGKAVDITAIEGGLGLEATISDPKIVNLIELGILNAFSVGFIPKDMEYDRDSGGFVIKKAELLEVSVVSVPANQEALFQQVKSWDSSEFTTYKNMLKGAAAQMQTSANQVSIEEPTQKENIMTQEQIEAMMKDVADKTAAKVKMELAAQKAADEKAAKEKAAAEAKAKADLEATSKVAIEAGKTGAEALIEEMKKTFDASQEASQAQIDQLMKDFKDRGAEIDAMRSSKRAFEGAGEKDFLKAHADEIVDMHLLGLVTKKGWETKAGSAFMEKAAGNADSGVTVTDPDVNIFENTLSNTIMREIQNQLILFPMFRNIAMNSSTMTLPILPDAGYASFNKVAQGSPPNGSLSTRGDTFGSPYGGNSLEAKILRVKTLISNSVLGDETEEDAIVPILPLIREGVVRMHARTIESSILMGGHALANVPDAFDGLLEMSKDAGTVIDDGAFASTQLTAAKLLNLRKQMGKYGIRPTDVVYVVSQQAYFDLLQDGEFQDANLVGGLATKLTGAIGQLYGSPVVLCDEFNAPGLAEGFAMAVNPSNYVTTTLRGVRLERDRDVANQRDIIVASQRMGFEDLFEGATAVASLRYAAS